MPTFDPIFARDPGNPDVIASNATITIFDPADPAKTPIPLTRSNGAALPNPYTVDRQGMGPAFSHPTLYRVGWEGGGFSNFFTAYEEMHTATLEARTASETAANLAEDAQSAAQAAAATAATEAAAAAQADLEARIAAGQFEGPAGPVAELTVGTVETVAGSPLDAAVVADQISTPGTLANTALTATTAKAMHREIPLRGAADRFRQLTVMVYHPVNMTTFRNDLDYYQEWNYKTVTMRDVWEHLEGISTLPDKPLWITFDDGLPTQYTAAEELKNRGMKGIFYIATGWIDGTVTQAQGGFAEATPLTWTQIQQMHAWGHDIQSHTKSHIPLGDQVEATVKAEFTQSKARIESQVPGTLVEYIAYPYGSWNDNTEVWLEAVGCKLGRAVRIDRDGRYPGPNMGRDAIATTAHRRFGIPCAGANFGDVQRPNFYREIGHEPEWCPDYGFEGGAKGWSLGSGFSVDTNAANAHSGSKSLTCIQGTSTVSSRPFRVMPIGPFNRLQISGWIRSTLPAGSYARVQLQTIKYDGTVNGTNIDIGTVTGPAGWTKFNYEYVGLEHDRNALLFIAVQGNAAPSGQAWFDDISVKVENPPSALSV